LAEVSTELESSRVTLIMGPNGAGKSTLLSILATLSRPTSGEVRYGEQDHRVAEHQLRHRIGLVAHNPMLYAELTGRENLRFFAALYGIEGSADRTEEWLKRVEVGDAGDRAVRELSRGMAQRIALARALIHDPDLVLLDEPFTGLDSAACGLLRKELARAAEMGKVVVVVSHDVAAVDRLCSHLLVLRRGRLAVDLLEPQLDRDTILDRYHGAI
jgi:heme exporter protein A